MILLQTFKILMTMNKNLKIKLMKGNKNSKFKILINFSIHS
jgi:hypothetical protein